MLDGEPLCRSCREAGYTVAATELDHIVPVAQAPQGLWHPGAVQPICRACHEAKTARENGHDETPEQVEWRERLEAMS